MTADEIMYRGFMPEIYRQSVSPSRYYRNYLRTYVERDVRMMVNIRNLAMFEKFLRLLAGRIGQLAGVDLSLPMNNILPFRLGVDLMDGARFRTVANSKQDIGKGKVTVGGTIIPNGIYTSENCEWVEGEGHVNVGCAGTIIIVR